MHAERLATHAQELFQIELTDHQLVQLATYEQEMLSWNASRANLTRITDPETVEIRHFLDSMSILHYTTIPEGARVADVGTGAGFPGLVLKIIRPDIHLTLIESIGKKVDFLRHISKTLQLDHVTLLNERAETAGQLPDHREQYDIVVARALAAMPTLSEYLLPLCKVGGRCVAMKGNSAIREIDEGSFAIEVLGGRFTQMFTVNLPNADSLHILVMIDKVEKTTDKYPRRIGIPSKRPLSLKESS